jgi:glycolate oxidase iron-sulfur subunit
MADRLGQRKIENIRATGATAVVMGNVGCLMQIRRHLARDLPSVTALHTIDVLHAAYTGEMPPEWR